MHHPPQALRHPSVALASLLALATLGQASTRANENPSAFGTLRSWGIPQIETYSLRETGIRGDFHSLSTFPNGELAALTSDGVFSFDGTNWERIEAIEWPMHLLSLPESRALVACAGGLVELTPSADGSYQSRSLIPPETRSEYPYGLNTVAVARGHAFGLNGDNLVNVAPDGTAAYHKLSNWSHGIFSVGDELYAIGGLDTSFNRWDWERGGFIDHSLVFDDAILEWMIGFAPRRAGGAWLLTQSHSIIEFDGTGSRPWPGNEALERHEIRVKSFTELSTGALAIGSVSQGLFIIDAAGQVLAHYSKSHGLDNVNVLQVGQDTQDGLWLAMKSGLARIPLDPNTVVFDERHGLPETVISLAFFDGRIFAGAAGGVYASRSSAESIDRVFEHVLPQSRASDLLAYGDHLFIGNTPAKAMTRQGDVYEIDGGSATSYWQPSSHPGVVLVCDFEGIRRLEKRNGRWSHSTRLAGPKLDIVSIVESEDGALFGSTGNNRLARIDLSTSPGSYHVIELPIEPSGRWISAVEINGEVYVNGPTCLRWDAGSERFVEAPDMHYFPGNPPHGFKRVFGTSPERAFVARNDRRGSTVPRPPSEALGQISSLGNAVETRADCIEYDANGDLWAGGAFGLIHHSVREEAPAAPAIQPRLHRIASTRDDALLPLRGQNGKRLVLTPGQTSLRIEMEFPKLRGARHHQYQIEIQGLDTAPPAFSGAPWREVTNLAPGEYLIRPSARDASGQSFSGESVAIYLAAPWYHRPWAYALYALAAAFAVAGIVRYHNRAQIRKGRELQALVRNRTLEIETKNQELERQAETLERQNDQLEEKTEELQVTTRSLSNTLRQLQETQDQLVSTARTAGKAEIATNILHSVGNALNSINTSRDLLARAHAGSKVGNVMRLAQLLESRVTDLSDFLTSDPKGKIVPEYLTRIATVLQKESEASASELAKMREDIDYVKRIIAAQQVHAKSQTLPQDFDLRELVATAFTMFGDNDHPNLQRRNEVPQGMVMHSDKHRLLEILLNLISNALDSVRSYRKQGGLLTIAAKRHDQEGIVEINVIDNGAGIDESAKRQLFTHGFTTKDNGHGFGLHSAAIAAHILDGTLTLESDGPGCGATATIALPRVYRSADVSRSRDEASLTPNTGAD